MNETAANLIAPQLAGPKPPGEGWSRTKWIAVIAIIFVAHIAIIFAFGEKKQIVPRAVKIVPSLKLADGSGELFALDDPTLFALPHLEGFAGPALRNQELTQFHRQDWTEKPRWLDMPAESLGATFQQFVKTNFFASHPLDFKPEAKLSALQPVESALEQNSTMQIEGELSQRRLLDETNLPSLQYSDVIAPSVVQILVNEAGDVVSPVLLDSSGFTDADDKALKTARAARFAPSPKMTLGKLIFNWRTIPLAATNQPPSSS
jgi:TonB family protein